MTESVKRPLAKRKLKDISFDQPSSHIALVSKQQGGAANGHNYALLLKSKDSIEDRAALQKAQAVQVTMQMPDFLERFFYLYEDDAKFLASLMGWKEVEETATEEVSEYTKYVEDRIGSIEIMKSLHDADYLSEVISELTADEYLQLRKDQALIEKAFRKQERLEKKAAKDSLVNTENKGEPEAGVLTQDSVINKAKASPLDKNNKENKMELEALQKAMDDQKVELQKALDIIKEYQAKEKESILKSKLAKIAEVVDTEADAQIIAKAALALETENDFVAFVEVIKGLKKSQAASDLFKEVGSNQHSADVVHDDNLVAKLLKSQFASK